jgi:hypothetical protein
VTRSRTTARGRAGTRTRTSSPAGKASTTPDGATFRKLVARETPGVVLIVTHEIPIRYALNAGAGSDDLDSPMHEVRNATPYLFDDPSLLRAAERIDELTG